MKPKQRIDNTKKLDAIDVKLRKFYCKRCLLFLEEHFVNDGWPLGMDTAYKPPGMDTVEFRAFLKENDYHVKTTPDGLRITGKRKDKK